ncbi:MAG: hypothetical protein H6Q86_4749, partial [candidate division NC10 bacterium]|nr:hypothetical protein [candidate division NC10 bacterium]
MKGRLWLMLSVFALAGMLLPWGPAARAADQWPSKPITLIVGFGAGGGTDVIARTLTKEMVQYLKQSYMTINMTGASGAVAG